MTSTPNVNGSNGAQGAPPASPATGGARPHIPPARDEARFGGSVSPRRMKGWRRFVLPLLLAAGLIPAAAAGTSSHSDTPATQQGTYSVSEPDQHGDDLYKETQEHIRDDLFLKEKDSGKDNARADKDKPASGDDAQYKKTQKRIRDTLFVEEDR